VARPCRTPWPTPQHYLKWGLLTLLCCPASGTGIPGAVHVDGLWCQSTSLEFILYPGPSTVSGWRWNILAERGFAMRSLIDTYASGFCSKVVPLGPFIPFPVTLTFLVSQAFYSSTRLSHSPGLWPSSPSTPTWDHQCTSTATAFLRLHSINGIAFCPRV
jgi:hypothetical protein